jgi:hypothetical protein
MLVVTSLEMTGLPPVERLGGRVVSLCLVGLWLLWPARLGEAQTTRDPEGQGRLLFNLAHYVEWPSETLEDPEKPFVIGLLGCPALEARLRQSLQGKQVRNRRIEIQVCDRVEQASDCHVLFVSKGERPRLGRVLEVLEGEPVLTISGMEGFARAGGMVGLFVERGRIRFQINHEAVRKGRLVMSARLLRAASQVFENASE